MVHELRKAGTGPNIGKTSSVLLFQQLSSAALHFACTACRMVCGGMPALILPLIEAAAHWPVRGALVGLDLGTKTIGVAVSNPDRRLPTRVETIQRKAFKADAARLLAIAAERNVVGFA